MRTATGLLATLIPLIGAGGWLAGRATSERWQAATLPSLTHAESEGTSARSQIDLVVEYEPPPAPSPESERSAQPARTAAAAVDLESEIGSVQVPGSMESTVMQRLLKLQERIERDP